MHTIVAAHTPPTVCYSRVGGRAYDDCGNNVWGLAPFLGESICDWHGFPVKGTSPNTRSVVCATVCRPQALPLITLVPSPSGRSSAPRASSSGYWRSPDVTQIRCGHPANENSSPPARPSRTGSRLGLGVRLSVGTRDLVQLAYGAVADAAEYAEYRGA